MAALTPSDFVCFMESFMSTYGIALADECPQATTYIKTKEFMSLDYPHTQLMSEDFDSWSLTLKEVLAKNSEADGFVCWLILEKEGDLSREEIQVLLVIYNKEDDVLNTYLSEKDLLNFQEVDLSEEMPNLMADYSEPLVKH